MGNRIRPSPDHRLGHLDLIFPWATSPHRYVEDSLVISDVVSPGDDFPNSPPYLDVPDDANLRCLWILGNRDRPKP